MVCERWVTQAVFSYLCTMFVHRKKHRYGRTSVVVVDKSHGKFREVKNFGVGSSDSEIVALCRQASEWIRRYGGQLEMDFIEENEKQQEEEETDRVLSNIDSLLINGHRLILDQVYDSIGFNQIDDEILRSLVIARVSQPMSKRATVEYLKSYFDEDVELHSIYRYMDKLYSTRREEVQRISVGHTRRVLGGNVGLLFYDVTTLYFETAEKDVLRDNGFSKDGKTAESQIVLGLLVSRDGYPLSYCIFNGKQYEGYTMIPIIDDFIQRFSLADFVVVADAGLMSKRNVQLLEDAGYKYIIGARIHTESESTKKWILKQEKVDGKYYQRKYGDKARLILGYSSERAKKDAHKTYYTQYALCKFFIDISSEAMTWRAMSRIQTDKSGSIRIKKHFSSDNVPLCRIQPSLMPALVPPYGTTVPSLWNWCFITWHQDRSRGHVL